MRSQSLTKLPQSPIKKNSGPSDVLNHRKQIEGTLKQLHQLQSEIYELNVPDNPHSSSPVKKQIKQLSYLYQNMVKEPKQRNELDIKSQDIQVALRIMNRQWNNQVVIQPQIGFTNGNQINLMKNTISSSKNKTKTGFKNKLAVPQDNSYKVSRNLLQHKFEQMTNQKLQSNFIVHESDKKYDQDLISVSEIYKFINYTESQYFDPIQEAYKMFLDSNGKFDKVTYNKFSQILGLPPVKNWSTFLAAVHNLQNGNSLETDTLTLEQFKKTLQLNP